jgi:hypothetical protein
VQHDRDRSEYDAGRFPADQQSALRPAHAAVFIECAGASMTGSFVAAFRSGEHE